MLTSLMMHARIKKMLRAALYHGFRHRQPINIKASSGEDRIEGWSDDRDKGQAGKAVIIKMFFVVLLALRPRIVAVLSTVDDLMQPSLISLSFQGHFPGCVYHHISRLKWSRCFFEAASGHHGRRSSTNAPRYFCQTGIQPQANVERKGTMEKASVSGAVSKHDPVSIFWWPPLQPLLCPCCARVLSSIPCCPC